MLHSASIEQNAVLAVVGSEMNTTVQAVAGAGKTTTIMHLAMANPARRILVLTYNSRLKIETRRRATQLGATNLEIHSYHAFGYRYISNACSIDAGLIEYVRDPTSLVGIIPEWDIICVDEIQDMTSLLYQIVVHITSALPRAQMVLFGDVNQCIYGFKGADERYLTLPRAAWSAVPGPWAHMRLTTSYRLTYETADFVQNVMMNRGGFQIRGCRSGAQPDYYIMNPFDSRKLVGIVKGFLAPPFGTGAYLPSDIFILASSVNVAPNSPLSRFENELSAEGVPIWSNVNREIESVTEELLEGKLCISTFHAAKGLERRVVIVMGFDSWFYNTKNNANERRDTCPNILYVAATRAMDHLVLIHAWNNGYLSFLDQANLKKYCTVHGRLRATAEPIPPPSTLNLERGLRHLNDMAVEAILDSVEFVTLVPAATSVRVKDNSEQVFGEKNMTESVSDINSWAVMAYSESRNTGELPLIWLPVKSRLPHLDPAIAGPLVKGKANRPTQDLVTQYLKLAAIAICLDTGYEARLNQIAAWDWITPTTFTKLVVRLESQMNSLAARFNRPCQARIKTELGSIDIEGRVDIETESAVYNVYCLSKITPIHRLRLVCMAAIHPSPHPFQILNIRTGEVEELTTRGPAILSAALANTVRARYGRPVRTSDAEFTSMAEQTAAAAFAVQMNDSSQVEEWESEIKVGDF